MFRRGGHRFLLLIPLAWLLVLLALTPIVSNDIWLHLRTGDLLLEHAQVPRADAYTFTRAGTPYIAHEWLAQALFALAYRHGGGLTALSFLYAALAGLLVGLVHSTTLRWIKADGGDLRPLAWPAAAVATVAAFYLVTSHLAIRPHLFTFLLAMACQSLLRRLGSAQMRPRMWRVLGLLLLQVLWANLHGGFMIGILLAAIGAADAMLRRREVTFLAALPLALGIASCVNPSGWHLYALIPKFSDPVFRGTIVEWQSPFLRSFAATPFFAICIVWFTIALAASIQRARRSRETAPLMTVLVFGAMSAVSRRHISLLVILTAPVVGWALASAVQRLERRVKRAALAAGWCSLLVACAAACFFTWRLSSDRGMPHRPGVTGRNTPVEALEVMRAEDLRGRVFTTIGLGAYVTWRGWPGLLTSIDSRLEVFGGEFLLAHLAATRDAGHFRRFFRERPFDFTLLPWRLDSVRGALDALASDPEWVLIYFDDTFMLHARRTPELQATIDRRGFRAIDPLRFLADGGFPAGIDRGAAQREARRAALDAGPLPERPPVNTLALMMLRSVAP